MAEKIRVLYVDDEPALLDLGKIFLERSGDFSVTIAPSAPEAIRILEQEKFDAIISDYQMPDMDGIQLLLLVRTRFGQIPFILFTGKGREEVVFQALNNGADGYLRKGGEPGAQFAELSHKIKQSALRKRGDDALRKSEEVLRSMLDATPVGVGLLVNRVLQNVNHSLCKITGYSEEEMIGQSTRMLYPDDEMYFSVGRELYGQMEREGLGTVETRLKTKGGAIIRVILSLSPFDLQNVTAGVTATVLDITDRQQTEEALRESESFNRGLVENLPEYIVIYGLDGKILYVNPASVRALGHSAEELVGTSVLSYVAPECRDVVTAKMAARQKGGDSSAIETDIVTRDGLRRTVIVQGTTIQYHNNPANLLFLIDITERKQAELERVSDQKKLKEAHRLAHIGIWNWVIENDTVTWSEELYKIAGRDPSLPAPTYEEHPRFYTPSSWNRLSAAVTRAFATGEPYNLELELVRPDGSIRRVNAFGGVERDDNGKIIGLHGMVQDITARKQAEEALRESEEMMRYIVKYDPNAIAVFDGDLHYIAVSDRYLQDYNVREKDILGKHHYEVFPEMPQKWKEVHQRCLAGAVEQNDDDSFERPDGSITYNHWICLPWYKADGSIGGIITYTEVTTDRKRAEEALKESEEKFRGIFDMVNDGIQIHEIEPDGKPGKFIDVNEVACRMLQNTREELLKHGPLDITTGYHNRSFNEIIGELSTKGYSIFEAEHQRKDGTIVPVEINSHVVRLQGKRLVVAAVRDITDRKQAEEELRQANKQLNLLSSITRHDILNQLMALKGYLELSREVIDNPTALIEYITKEEKAANTIEHQIMFTRDYQELGAAAPAWQNVNANIQKAVVGLPMRDVRVDVDRTDLEIFADPLFVKVFYNLVDNALRHGGDQMKTIQVSSQESDRGHTIVFEDDGIGISAEDKKYLFTRGFGKNTGLGLFLTREILGITGITITENGVPGKGARFEIMVPNGAWRSTGKGA